MKKLLKYQLRKFLQKKATYICIIIVLISMTFNVYISNLLGMTDDMTGFSFMSTVIGQGTLGIILAVYVSGFACMDRTNDVLKNIYARGYTPTSVTISEFIVSLIFGAVTCILEWLSAFIIGTAFFGGVGKAPDNMVLMLLSQMIVICAYVSLFFMISKLVVRSAAAYSVNIVGQMMLGIASSLLDMFFEFKDIDISITPYTPDGLLVKASLTMTSAKELWITAGVSMIYVVVGIALSILFSRKRPA